MLLAWSIRYGSLVGAQNRCSSSEQEDGSPSTTESSNASGTSGPKKSAKAKSSDEDATAAAILALIIGALGFWIGNRRYGCCGGSAHEDKDGTKSWRFKDKEIIEVDAESLRKSITHAPDVAEALEKSQNDYMELRELGQRDVRQALCQLQCLQRSLDERREQELRAAKVLILNTPEARQLYALGWHHGHQRLIGRLYLQGNGSTPDIEPQKPEIPVGAFHVPRFCTDGGTIEVVASGPSEEQTHAQKISHLGVSIQVHCWSQPRPILNTASAFRKARQRPLSTKTC